MNDDNFDYERLRYDLIDYFGTAMINVSFVAINDLTIVERASNEELIKIARECGINLDKYIVNYKNHTY